MINMILWLLFGALIGWVASLVMRTDEQQGAVLNILVGTIGAMVGGFLFDANTINSSVFSLPSLFVSLIGAIILLGLVNLMRRGRMR